MKKYLIILLLIFSTPLSALSPDDYAYGMSLSVDGSSPIYAMPLPDAVYRNSVQKGLDDVQVFNAAGETVPFRLERPQAMRVAEEERRLSLSLFPVRADAGANGDNNNLEIEFDDDGRIETITSSSGASDDARRAYIIDTRKLELVIDELVFAVESEKDSFVQPVAIDTSNDLHDWRTIEPRATLARLQHEGQALERLSVKLSHQPGDYLRVRLLDDAMVSLKSVTAIVLEPAAAVPETNPSAWRSRTVSGVADPEAPAVFYYDLQASYPVEHLNLVFEHNNTLGQARFESRNDKDSQWQLRKHARVYTLAMENMAFRNDNIAVEPFAARYWKVTLTNAGSMKKAPVLHAGWQPHRLVFLARGDGPFTLAYGRSADPGDQVKDEYQLLDSSLPESLLPGSVNVVRDHYALGGEEQLKSKASLINWRTAGLWTVLILAVVMLAYMALRLYREINRRPPAG